MIGYEREKYFKIKKRKILESQVQNLNILKEVHNVHSRKSI